MSACPTFSKKLLYGGAKLFKILPTNMKSEKPWTLVTIPDMVSRISFVQHSSSSSAVAAAAASS